jgi:hypothetical protein
MEQGDVIFNETIAPTYFEELSYPLAARLTHTVGTVIILVKLGNKGEVLSSTAISGSKNLISDCLANAKRWRFQPNARKTAIIVYRFKIEGLCNLPCKSHFQFEPPNFVTIVTGEPVVDHSVK